MNLLLIISGSVAACKAPELIRQLQQHDVTVTCVLTSGGAHFVTVEALEQASGNKVYTDMWEHMPLAEEVSARTADWGFMPHIHLSRAADLVAVIPASADILAKMAHGLVDDLATNILLASDKPIVVAPAMNTCMWEHPATCRNVAQLKADGVQFIEPESGVLACGEIGEGRMAEIEQIAQALLAYHSGALTKRGVLAGKTAIITAGPTFEPIDPVRFLGNRSSGKQGYALAAALCDAGVNVTLVSGPTSLPDVPNVRMIRVETAQQMQAVCETVCPVDIAVCTAAVSDWRPMAPCDSKLKKSLHSGPPILQLEETSDILRWFCQSKGRPALVIGFAAETENLLEQARAKRVRKGADWMVANNVSDGQGFNMAVNTVTLITDDDEEMWEQQPKSTIAARLVAKIAAHFHA